MRRSTFGLFLLSRLAAAFFLLSRTDAPFVQAQDLVARAGPRTPEEERKCFHLPPGFEIQLVAAEPFVRKPMNINFDDRGRLWVTESVEYPYAATGRRHRDTVRILEDVDGNGSADEVTVFTSGLNIPIGVLPVTHGAIVFSIPEILKLQDQDGDDRADRRERLYGTYGQRDTHGLTGEFSWGFDGWVYACHGYANNSEIRAADGSSIKMNSGNVYRFKPDGSRVEPFTWGQVNPFGLTFDPLGNLYSCDCHSRPVYQLLRGAYYSSFGKPHDGLGYGPEMMTHDHGSTAIAGIAYYAADHFPPAYRDTVYVGNVVTNRINHDRLERHGSTLLAIQQPDFLSCDDPWFRPVDIKLGPDGALYVADFYNRIIGHYEVPLNHPGRDRERGRIWRIVYRGPDGKSPLPRRPRADWNKASVAELVQDLGSPNLTVRVKATNQLVERGGATGSAAVHKAMAGAENPFVVAHGLWVLERTAALDEETLGKAVKDRRVAVRVHALRILTERKALNGAERSSVVARLKDPDAFVQRAAAQALGAHPSADNLRPLLHVRHAVPADDTHLLHVVRMALRDQLTTPDILATLTNSRWIERDARAIADVATGVPNTDAAGFLQNHLQHYPEPYETQARYVHHIARYGTEAMVGVLLADVRGDRGASLTQQAALLRAIHQGTQERGGAIRREARDWAEQLIRQLVTSNDEGEVRSGLDLGGALKSESARGLLLAVARNRQVQDAHRVSALNGLVSLDGERYVSLLGRLLADPAESPVIRERSAAFLANINSSAASSELLKQLPLAPERVAVAIAAGLAGTRPGTEKLLENIAAGKASPRLLQERQVEARLQSVDVPNLREKTANLTKGLPPADAKVQDLLRKRRQSYLASNADAAAGVKVYEKHCAACHQLANKGAKVGPQLDGIGVRGIDRILEDILDPHRNVDQAFRLTTLNLSNGQIVAGLLLREEGQVLVMADNQGKEVRVPKNSIEERFQSQLSPMPANFADQIPEAEFNQLLAYLLAQRPADGTKRAQAK